MNKNLWELVDINMQELEGLYGGPCNMFEIEHLQSFQMISLLDLKRLLQLKTSQFI